MDQQSQLNRFWADASKEIQVELSKLGVKPIQAPSDSEPLPAQVIAQLHAMAERDEKVREKHKTLFTALGKTVHMVLLLGGLAGQVAGMVFGGPSQVCLNAIGFLVSAAKGYNKIFTTLEELFSKIVESLERFNIYNRMSSRPDPLVVDISHRTLEMLVEICRRAVKILHENRLLKFTKVLAFNSDEGVGPLLTQLDQHSVNESRKIAALTYESTEETKTYVKDGFTRADNSFRGLRDQNEKMGKGLTALLGANSLKYVESLVGPHQKEDIQAVFQRYKDTRLSGTGVWLLEHESLKAWTDWDQLIESVLCLAADKGYGKSYLMAAAIEDLQRRYPKRDEQDSKRVTIAYSFCPDTKNAQSKEKEHGSISQPLDRALKAVAWQIARADSAYRTALQNAYMNDGDFGYKGIAELWKRLFTDVKTNSRFFIVLDGYDEPGEPGEASELSSLIKAIHEASQADDPSDGKPEVRLLYSAREITADEFNDEKIKVMGNNSEDMRTFLQSELDKMSVFRTEIRNSELLKSNALAAMMKSAKGNFAHAMASLNEIRSKEWTNEIEDLIKGLESGERPEDTVAREIQRCSETLGPQDISDLSRLLMWTINAECAPRISELEALLSLSSKSESLLSLEARIKDKFAQLLIIDEKEDGHPVSLAFNSIRDYFAGQSQAQQAEETPSDSVNKYEVQVLQQLLRRMCDDDLWTKFEFDSFFKSKMRRGNSRVSVDMATAQADIVDVCVRALFAPETDRVRPLSDYACLYLVEHLLKVDLSSTDLTLKTKIGQDLIKVFADKFDLPRYWKLDNRSYTFWQRNDWLYRDETAKKALEWFSDSAVKRGLSADHLEWLKNVGSSETQLFERVALFFADAWLFQRRPEVQDCFLFIRAYLNKLKNSADPAVAPRLEDDGEPEDVSATQIQQAATWALIQLKIDEPGAETLRRLAMTYREYRHWDEACTNFKKSAEMAEYPYDALMGLARVYEKKGDWKTAISNLDPFFRAEKEDIKAIDIEDSLRNAGRWYEKDGQYEKSIKKWQELLKMDPSDMEPIQQIVSIFCHRTRFAELVSFLQQVQQVSANEEGLDQLSTFHFQYADDEELHQKLAMVAVRHNDSRQIIKESYEKAIDEALKQQKSSVPSGTIEALRYLNGNLLFSGSTSDADRDHAMSIWKTIAAQKAPSPSEELLTWAWKSARKALISGHLQAIRTAGPNAAAAGKHVADLIGLARKSDVGYVDRELAARKVGRCYHLLGDTKHAQEALLPRIKKALEILTDDDPSNDWQGYAILADALTHYGDDAGACAAYSLVEPQDRPTEETEVLKSAVADTTDVHSMNGVPAAANATSVPEPAPVLAPATPSVPSAALSISSAVTPNSANVLAAEGAAAPAVPPQLVGPFISSCDGPCKRTLTLPDNIWVCRDCWDVWFCGDCRERHARRELDRALCHPAHEFLHIPPYGQAREARGGPGMVRVGERVMAVSAWLADIRQAWGLERDKEAGEVNGKT